MAEQQLTGPPIGALNLSPDGTVTRAEPIIRLPLQDLGHLLAHDNVRIDPILPIVVIDRVGLEPIGYRLDGWVVDDGAMILTLVDPAVLSPQ